MRTYRKPHEAHNWSVYILQCGDGSLYSGVAKDVAERLCRHAAGLGAEYTRSRLPIKLAYQECGFTQAQAVTREAEIRALPRFKKIIHH